jgi:pantoate--beta-alanine ligase
MQIVENPRELQTLALQARAAGRTVGLVPTMGNLHEGHLSLVRIARQHADYVIVSDFVNPTQFGPNEDFDSYPRTFEQDADLCRAESVDLLFHPDPPAMYASDASVSLIETDLSRWLCGASRPIHFNGVCTVVAKLFLLAQPHIAVFGEKDAQQLAVIRRMVRDLFFPIEIIPAPISREPDGLARSSRNRYLTSDYRAQAPVLHRSLEAAKALFDQGERRPAPLLEAVKAVLATAPDANVEYATLSDASTLVPYPADALEPMAAPALLALAVRFGTTRLIDNTTLAP